jgi:hypothetical protein
LIWSFVTRVRFRRISHYIVKATAPADISDKGRDRIGDLAIQNGMLIADHGAVRKVVSNASMPALGGIMGLRRAAALISLNARHATKAHIVSKGMRSLPPGNAHTQEADPFLTECRGNVDVGAKLSAASSGSVPIWLAAVGTVSALRLCRHRQNDVGPEDVVSGRLPFDSRDGNGRIREG